MCSHTENGKNVNFVELLSILKKTGISHYRGTHFKPFFNISSLHYIMNMFCSPCRSCHTSPSPYRYTWFPKTKGTFKSQPLSILHHFLSLSHNLSVHLYFYLFNVYLLSISISQSFPFFCFCLHVWQWRSLKKKLQRFDDKREEGVFGHKKNHNSASIKDATIIMVGAIS